MKNICFFLFITFGFIRVQAQQDAMFSRYMFNTMYLFNNPAYSGSHGYWTTNALYRTQWANIDGAPKTIYAGGEGMIGQKQNAGLGFSLLHDKIGLDRVTDISANYAYHLQLNDDQRLSIGFKGSVLIYKSLLTQVVTEGPDPLYTTDISGVIPKAGLGVFWYGQDFFAGFSIPTLVAFDNRNASSLDTGILKKHYYFYGGYVFHTNNDIDIKPSLLLKYQDAAPLEADINCNIWFNHLFSVGVSYRTNDAVSLMCEVPVGERFSIGYAFDYTISKLQPLSGGTHEFMVGYNIVTDSPVNANPRGLKRF